MYPLESWKMQLTTLCERPTLMEYPEKKYCCALVRMQLKIKNPNKTVFLLIVNARLLSYPTSAIYPALTCKFQNRQYLKYVFLIVSNLQKLERYS